MADDQLQRNWEAFKNLSEDVKADNFGRTALFHDGELVAIYNDSGDAYAIGCEKFGLGHFTVETFGSKPKSLGFFTSYIRTTEAIV